jgi:hypothetical protein|tara:strand:+ start:234 stop:545 length:312 start_codon:yes stop_codon:yes gene_type:complete
MDTLKPLGDMGSVTEDETVGINVGYYEKLPFPRIVEFLPNNPKKAFMVYNKLYETLGEGADTPEEVKQAWGKYSKTKNITMFVRHIAKIIKKYYGENTTEYLK